jgi:hypothetical protein
MGIPAERFQRGTDIYFEYDFEDVMYRWEASTGRFCCRFTDGYDSDEEEVPRDQRLLNDALRFGDEITAEQYHRRIPTAD